MQDREAVAEI